MAETPENAPKPPQAPRGLEKAGKALWRDTWAVFDLRDEPHKLAVLEQACRTRDELTRLEAAMTEQPYMVMGSKQQPVVNPLVPEARFQRKTLAELLTRLGLPDNSDPEDPHERRRAAGRTAALARWNRGY